MSVYRHVQETSAKIKDQAITSQRIALSVQTGTGSPPAVAAYVSFSTAFGTPPIMDLEIIGPYGGAGTVTVGRLQRFDIARVRTGSFQWSGTPIARARWRAVGILDTSSA